MAVSAALFFLFLNTYAVVELMMLPKIFNWLAPVFGVLSAFFLWSAIRAASFWIAMAEKRAAGLFRSRVEASKNDLIVVAKRGRGGKGKKKRKLLFLR